MSKLKEATEAMAAVGTVINARADGRTDIAAKVLDKSFGNASEQLAVAAIEAANPRLFVCGWRPYCGWIAGTGLGMQVLILPIWKWIALLAVWPAPPAIDTEALVVTLGGMLGLAGARTAERMFGKATEAITSPGAKRRELKRAEKARLEALQAEADIANGGIILTKRQRKKVAKRKLK